MTARFFPIALLLLFAVWLTPLGSRAQAPAPPPAPPAPAPAAAPAPAPAPAPAAAPAPPAPTPTPVPPLALLAKDDPNLHMIAVEALVVEVNEERTRDLGITYSGTNSQVGANGTVVNGSGIVQGGNARLGRTLSTVSVPVLIQGNDGQSAVGFDQRLPGLGVSLVGMSVGSGQVAVNLRALLDSGDAQIRTRPIAFALNKTQVRIETVNEVPVSMVSGGGQLTVDFKKVGVLMEVTPEIVTLRPGVANLNLTKLEVSTVADFITTKNINRPVFNKSATQTKITLATGETFVIGGLKTRRKEHYEDRVPILGSIPLLGLLFRSQQDIERNRDVLFFVTPYILAPGENPLLPFDFKHQKELGVKTGRAKKSKH